MADANLCWYVNSVGYAAVTAWSANTAKTVGNRVRQLTTPTVGNERVYVCIVAGTTHATTEPVWTVTRGVKPTDGTVTWQECTGHPAVNGDVTNTAASSVVRSTVLTLGTIIKNNTATHYFICSTQSGTAGASEPTFNTTLGATTADSANVWTCIGPVGNFTAGGAPHARAFAAFAVGWYTNGQIVFVGHNHAETQVAAMTISAGQIGAPVRLICHNAAGSYPPTSATTGATITTTGANSITLGMVGCYVEGVTFSAGTGATNAAITFGGLSSYEKYKNCSFQCPGTVGSSSKITGSNSYGKLEWENCTVKFGSTVDSIRPRANSHRWHSTGQILAAGSAVPASLFQNASGGGTMGDIFLEDLDLSQCTGTILLQVVGAQDLHGYHVVRNCKLHASALVSSVFIGAPSSRIDVVNCSSGDINYDNRRHTYQGVQTTEITIVRTGGATDGTMPVSAKIVTTSGNRWEWAFECIPIAIWNEDTGSSITATVEGIWGGGAVPNNDDIWIEAVYLSDASSPLGTRVSGTKAGFSATNSALASSSETWSGSTTAFKMTVTFTPQQKGFIYVYVMVGRASATFYVDPKVTLS